MNTGTQGFVTSLHSLPDDILKIECQNSRKYEFITCNIIRFLYMNPKLDHHKIYELV
jgi:hypothetical protein